MFTRFQIKLLAWFVTGGLFTFPAILTATPSFLNANSFPIQVSLSHIGPFHN
jgi:hypothetical protein